MRLHELKAAEGATKARKRRGRGQGTGLGTTGGRGMNGQNSRSGGGVRLGFEGGQMPLYRRIPKRGFTNRFAKEYAVKQVKDGVKVLGNGELEKKLTVKAEKFSKSAAEKIEKAGGKAEVI